MHKQQFSPQTKQALKHYVYALVDPRDDTIFYVGKASANNRAFDHLKADPDETAKQRRIAEIRSHDYQPRVEILRSGLDSKEACFDVEAAIIDTIGLENLTNAMRGHGVARGRMHAVEAERLYGSPPREVAKIKDRLVLFFVNQTYSPTMNDVEVYDCVRQFWSGISTARHELDESGDLAYRTGLGIADGVVIRAYSIAAWFKAGTTLSTRGPVRSEGRWEFVGQELPEHELLGLRLVIDGKDLPAAQKGYRYIN
ncbi:LEM-3-like GIY-YIG domain-containing protein [Paraburkholderia sp. J67]|uniref:LEM-3-like GIY-YIG domain-containing protein n=1 Tax=Paraburkholderia sp. J67 TaxID=2805435 RepID=UPI002ABE65BD|nr:hypothetical protein [Paraburkholderia sp. J67]